MMRLEGLRKNFNVGTPFIISTKDDLIILKRVGGLTKEEMREMTELNKIWKEIDSGKGITQSKQEFLKEMNVW